MTLQPTTAAVNRTSAQPEILFNFGYIKRHARAGSWRRGYGYFRTRHVTDIRFTETGVQAKVKGKFKESYTINLAFSPQAVAAHCDCPLEEEWCKHAVSVGLECIEQNLWEEFWDIPIEDVTCPAEVVETADDYMGSYRIFLSEKKKKNRISLKFLDRQTGRLVKEIEPLLMRIIEMQGQHALELSEATRREVNVLKFIYQHEQIQAKDGWYHMTPDTAEELFALLAQVEEVCDTDNHRILFESEPLELVMGVNVSMAGNVLVSLHWRRKDPEDAYPLEEVALFSPSCRYGLLKNRLYRLSPSLDALPQKLTRATFTDIRDADGGKFMYEELPKLRRAVAIDETDGALQAALKQRPPQKILNLEMIDPAMLKIRASLEFGYDDATAPYSKATPDTPYIMIVKKSQEKLYWIKRDFKAEQAAYQQLLDGKLDPVQTNYLQAEGDNAIDFYNVSLKKLGDDWTIKTKEGDDFSSLNVADHPLKVCAETDFDESVDHFKMKIFCRLGDDVMDIDDVREQMLQGKKYFLMHGSGYVEIPLAAILQFNRTLQALDAEKMEDADGFDVYRVETFKVGLIGELLEQGVELEMSDKFAQFWKLITSFNTLEDAPIPEKVNADLRPYQKQGFNWLWFLYSYGLNGILADDMGLGKTLQTLVLLQHAKDKDGSKPSLVVCPSSIVYNWVNEARRFTPDLKVVQLTGSDRHLIYRQIEDADLVVTSYALMRRDARALKGYSFRTVILDESQNIKNWESLTAKAAKKLQCNHRLALSGTPIENRLLELWSVFDFLMPKFLYDIDEFRYRYVTPIEERGNIDAERRLKKQVFPFILRRLKQDVAKDLPPKVESLSYCELTEAQQELYLDILEKTRDEVFSQVADRGVDGSQMSIFSALLRLRQICCHPSLLGDELSKGVKESGKFEAIKPMLMEIMEEGGRILFYSQFVEMLKIVRAWLEVEGVRYEYLTGETPSEKRGEIVDRFNRDESIPIFLISLKAGGTGLNLTGADYVFLYDPWWNPAAEDQAADRAHRIGQTKTVFVYRMVTRGTVEEKIMKLKGRKRDLVDSIISADRAMGKLLSFEDLKDILTPDF